MVKPFRFSVNGIGRWPAFLAVVKIKMNYSRGKNLPSSRVIFIERPGLDGCVYRTTNVPGLSFSMQREIHTLGVIELQREREEKAL